MAVRSGNASLEIARVLETLQGVRAGVREARRTLTDLGEVEIGVPPLISGEAMAVNPPACRIQILAAGDCHPSGWRPPEPEDLALTVPNLTATLDRIEAWIEAVSAALRAPVGRAVPRARRAGSRTRPRRSRGPAPQP